MSTATVLAIALWLLCGAYATRFVYRGWIPHDEGTIGQSVERVLAGEVPHRDFEEVYTGGLTYLHAASMRIFGVNLRAPRLVVFGFFMAFLAAVYGIGRRVSSDTGGLAAMALCTAWSVPNYFVSLPSWYNLFFATFGVLVFLHYLETGHRRWIVIAGACGGFSVLAKISGVFYLAGGLLFLTYVEQTGVARIIPGDEGRRRSVMGFAIAAAACLLATALLVPLFAPALIVCLLIAWTEWRARSGPVADRATRLWSLLWPFAAGAAVPLVVFAAMFWWQDALPALIRGVFILPLRRLGEARWDPPSIATWGLAAPYALLVIAGGQRVIRREPLVALALAVPLGGALAFGYMPAISLPVSAIARSMTVVAVAAGAWLIVRRGEPDARTVEPRQRRLYLLMTMTAMVALVQFPYATPTYFFYAAPMTILAMIAVVFAQSHPPAKLHLCIAAFFLVFAVSYMNRSYAGNRDVSVLFVPYVADTRLELERGGLWIPAEDKQTYEPMVRLLKEVAAGGTVYAGPDCPEIYFLSGFRNPTPVIFDFLTPAPQDVSWMEALLARAPVRAVVINTRSPFSQPIAPAVIALLERRFPSSEQFGRFVVRFGQR